MYRLVQNRAFPFVGGRAYTIVDSEHALLKVNLPSDNMDVQNIALDMHPVSSRSQGVIHSAGQTFNVTPYVKDAGHESYVARNVAHVSEALEATHFIRLHNAGNTDAITLSITSNTAKSFELNSVRINARPPFRISLLRIICMLSAYYLIWLFWPTRSMYVWELNLKQSRQKILLAVFLILQAAVLIMSTQLILPARVFSSTYLTGDGSFLNDDNQYNHLADALIAGRPYLDLPVPQWLANASNPYDPGMRATMAQRTGQPSYWDYAFFNGKYYSYFGVLPALLTFVPFKILTGTNLRTDIAVALFAVLFLCASVYFLYRLFRRYVPTVSFGLYLISCLGFVTGSGVLTQTFLPKIYSLPILASLMFTLCGLALWIGAKENEDRISRISLILGAICIGANLGCRPQFVLTAFLAFPIFSKEIKEGLFFSVRGIVNTMCVILPFLLLGSAAMAYNHVRFGSFFNFGATYNLTGFDMVNSEHSWARVPWGIWLYLFQPIHLAPTYPFIEQIEPASMYMGSLIMEPMYGGLIVFAPMTLAICCIPHMRKELHHLSVLPIMRVLLIYACIVLLIDIRIVGVSSRYLSDIGWSLLACACISVAALLSKYGDPLHKIVIYGFVVLVLVGVFVSYWNLLSNGRYGELQVYNNTVYRIIESWFLPLA